MKAQLMQQLVSIVLSFVVPLMITLLTLAIRKIAQAMSDKAEATLSKETRDAVYAAIKIGKRVADSHAGVIDDLETVAITTALDYLRTFGIDLKPAFIRQLLQAETQKQSDQTLQPVTWSIAACD